MALSRHRYLASPDMVQIQLYTLSTTRLTLLGMLVLVMLQRLSMENIEILSNPKVVATWKNIFARLILTELVGEVYWARLIKV